MSAEVVVPVRFANATALTAVAVVVFRTRAALPVPGDVRRR
jgi:hypothetical protein